MEQESLEVALDKCLEAIENADIQIIDKAELLLNVYHFLDSKKYDENIMILSRRRKDERY